MSYRPRTLAIHAGQPNDERTGAATVPIYQTSTFEQSAPGVDKGYSYARTAHPTREALERCIAELEGSEHGPGFACASARASSNLKIGLLGTTLPLWTLAESLGGVKSLLCHTPR